MASEFEEVVQRERETTQEFESEKKEILQYIDDNDLDAKTTNKSIRNKTIDVEIEVKRLWSDINRVKDFSLKEKQTAKERKEEIGIELNQIKISKESFRKEMDQTERELRIQLEGVEAASRELGL